MSKGNEPDNADRLARLEDQVKELGSDGFDVSKVNKALEQIKRMPLDEGNEDLRSHLDKLETVIGRMKKKKKGGRIKRVTKPKIDKGAGGADAPEGEESAASEVGATREPDDIETSKVEPVDFNEGSCQEMMGAIKERLKAASERGADIKPIAGHIGQLQNALDDRDQATFDSYLSPTLEWIEEVERQLAVSGLVETVEEVRGWLELIGKADPDRDLSETHERLGKASERIEGASKDEFEEISKDIGSLKKDLEKDINNANKEIEKDLKDTAGEIEELLSRAEGEQYPPLREEFEKLKGEEGPLLWRYDALIDLKKRIGAEVNSKGLKKLDGILISVEPLIARAGEIEGLDSSTYLKLIEEKEKVIQASHEDIEKAMEMVDSLLDTAARAVAESEENWIAELNNTIKRERAKAQTLSGPYIDPSPVLKILDKAEGLVEDGKPDEAQELFNKAASALDRLRAKKKAAEVQNQISEMEGKLVEMEGHGVDVSPVKDALEEVRSALTSGDTVEMEGSLAKAKERLEYLKLEEFKVEYQQLLIPILNDLRALKNEGKDVKDLDERFEDIKLIYTQRNFEEAVEGARGLRSDLIRIRISDILRESLDLISQTMKEAEAVGIEMDPFRKRLSSADQLINNGEIDQALDRVTGVQVELDIELNKRVFSTLENQIRGLMKEASELDLPLEDIEGEIKEAKELTYEEKHNEAMERLASLKVGVEGKLEGARAGSLMNDLMERIKEARSVGLSIADYKTSHTKAKIRLDAGDIEGAVAEVGPKIPKLKEEIEKRRGVLEVLDRLRGRLLAQEGKISRLVTSGVNVGDLPDMVNTVSQKIESLDVVSAEVGLESLEEAIGKLIHRAGPGVPSQPQRRQTVRQVETNDTPLDNMGPEEARKKLFELIPKIKKEMASSHRGAENFKGDLEVIMKLVASRDYLKAYRASLECYDRVKGA